MNELESLQNAFGRYLFTGDPAVAAAVVATERLDAVLRLSIYSNAYHARLSGVLTTDYPVLHAVLGETVFADLSRAYIAAWPSTSFTLRGFGRYLPEFVAISTGIAERAPASELARFESAFIEAFDAPDAAAVGVTDMGQIEPAEWPSLSFVVHPSVQMVDTRFNTLRVWDAVKAGRRPPAPDELPVRGGALVWRQALTTVFRSLQSDELLQWRLLAQGADFAGQCAALADRLDPRDVPVRAATLLRNWLTDGLISGLHAP